MRIVQSLVSLAALGQVALAQDSRTEATLAVGGPSVIVSGRQTSVLNVNEATVHFTFSKCVTGLVGSAFSFSARNTVNGATVGIDSRSIGPARSNDFQDYSVALTNLQDNVEYTVTLRDGAAFECTKARDGASCTRETGALSSTASDPYSFTIVTSAVSAGISSDSARTITDGNGDVKFSVTFSRDVVPNGVNTRGFFEAVDQANRALPIRDITYGTRTWTFTVAGTNNARIVVNLLAGAAMDFGGNASGNSSPRNLSRQLAFRQDCDFTETTGAWSTCSNGQQSRSVTTVVVTPALFGGAACPPSTSTETRSCTGSGPQGIVSGFATCAGNCGAQDNGGCGCDDACIFRGDCCPDVAQVCRSFAMPSCATQVNCGGVITDIEGGDLCSCDASCTRAGNCCPNFQAGCEGLLCALKYDIGSGRQPAWCTRSYDEAVDANKQCTCDAECMENGDCCADFAGTCAVQTTCSRSFNCGYAFLVSADYGCACDHSCIAAGDCCADYNDVCEVQATCAGTCGSAPWDQSPAYNPAGVEGTANRWCGCDDQCDNLVDANGNALPGDCCDDKARVC